MNITSTVPYARFPGGYLAASGTSMATPMVSGAAALAMAAFGGVNSISPPRLRELLIDSADYVPALDGKVVSKVGLLEELLSCCCCLACAADARVLTV